MKRLIRIAVALPMVAVLCGLMGSRIRAAELTEADFKRLHAELQPAGDELWQTIPWQIALLDAQRTAVKEHKPIFIWAMDGHPLGCT